MQNNRICFKSLFHSGIYIPASMSTRAVLMFCGIQIYGNQQAEKYSDTNCCTVHVTNSL